ncbi:hypothetical protein [Streptomyces sp. V4I8]|uniref:hypothetical protein n=1 Tax=Streptomyces sp. V4I8 TaxID=3156469 RepID=UPI003512AE41
MAIDASHLARMPTEEFLRFVQRMNPALRVVLERHRARLLGEPDIGSFNSFIEPGL